MRDRHIRASELKSFAFCKRAWYLEREGVDSTLREQRTRGIDDHIRHNHAIQQASAVESAASLLIVLGVAGIAVAFLSWWFFR